MNNDHRRGYLAAMGAVQRDLAQLEAVAVAQRETVRGYIPLTTGREKADWMVKSHEIGGQIHAYVTAGELLSQAMRDLDLHGREAHYLSRERAT